ncbi:DUF2812 domain-containing protein [Bacillus sp. REN16]|uniref:DUF2812 domain-containing protein n=1 Tax=Bacillus sp. REN16 TaxID=2887296 RepID=UPI001E33769C|nr:DUF2812 domain-containing protein [Bacillus sp. REN16]MCC3359609.1 DUF2812 domain-containing protein [Bacillus sp. REN16]
MKTVKFRFFADYEKEEKWVNEMAAQGWHLEKFFLGRFTFAEGEPGAFIYRNEFISLSGAEKDDYFEFLRDSGITIINEFGGWVYMKKATADGPFELYTDTKSKITYYKRLINLFFLLFLVNAWMGYANISIFWDKTEKVFISPYIGILNILAALLMAYPMIKIFQRKKALEKDQQFFE